MTKAVPKYRSASPRRHRAASCLVACSALLISAALIAISLLLPPINLPDRLLARQYIPLNAEAPTIALEGELRLSLPPGETASDYAVKLERLTAVDFSSDFNSDPDNPVWLAAARAELPHFLELVSPVYLIESRGEGPAALQIELKLPTAASAERQALYGWDEDAWRFIPSAVAAGVFLGAADFAPRALAGFQFLADSADYFALAGGQPGFRPRDSGACQHLQPGRPAPHAKRRFDRQPGARWGRRRGLSLHALDPQL